MRLATKLIIGITISIILICAGYCVILFHIPSSDSKYSSQVGKIEYKGQFLMPVENFNVVTSKYGARIDPISKEESFHTGIDLVGDTGSNILNIKKGEVTWAGWSDTGYGNCVEIKHIDETGKVFYSFYAHMRDNSICVEAGQLVVEGQVLGIQGSTGWSTGEHLHFEIRLEDKIKIDPTPYLFTEM